MTKYTLTYFPFKGRAETIRFIFHVAGVKYTDNRIEMKDWPALKPNAPFGSLPMLEVDGKKLGQSNAICRYVAKANGLGGKNDYETALIDSAAETITDVRENLFAFAMEKDEGKKAAASKDYMENILPGLLTKIENFFVTNSKSKGDSGFIAGEKVSWADLHLVVALEPVQQSLFKGSDDFLTKTPKLQKLVTRINDLDKVKDWRAKRPQTDM